MYVICVLAQSVRLLMSGYKTLVLNTWKYCFYYSQVLLVYLPLIDNNMSKKVIVNSLNE